MHYRKELEELEANILATDATLSLASRGREYQEPQCDLRTVFQRDRDRIIHSKSFRRLKHKTQVFIAPEGDHYRTRLTHTLEVAQVARGIAKALALNEDLTEAIALGHDLGHTPFGHAGEEALNRVYEPGFEHNQQSLRVVKLLEFKKSDYPGLNLTYEVRDGILKHTGSEKPLTLEGQIVKIADRIAYINHDIDDARRGGIISGKDLPQSALDILGGDHSLRINRMVRDIIENSYQAGEIKMSTAFKEATNNLREFLYDNVYIGSQAKNEEDKVTQLLKNLYNHYNQHPHQLPTEFKEKLEDLPLDRIVVDYIAGMTDRYALKKAKKIFLPQAWPS